MVESRKSCDAFREQYDILIAEDKVMDKQFKKEFHDVPAVQVDQLHKLFRRRPRYCRHSYRSIKCDQFYMCIKLYMFMITM